MAMTMDFKRGVKRALRANLSTRDAIAFGLDTIYSGTRDYGVPGMHKGQHKTQAASSSYTFQRASGGVRGASRRPAG